MTVIDGEVAALFEKGRLLWQQGKNKQAASCLEQAGKALLLKGDEEKALSLWQSAIDLGTGEPLRQWLSLMERHAKSLSAEQTVGLLRWLAQTYGDDCNDGRSIEYLADRFHKLNEHKQALPLHKKAYSLGRQSPQTCNLIAISLSRLIRVIEALDWFEKGKEAPYDKEIAYWKGFAILISGLGSQREMNRLWDGWGRELLAGAPPRPPMPPKPRPLRLGFCSLSFGRDSFQARFIAQLAPALARRGVEVRLYVFQEKAASLPEWPGCEWVRLGKLDYPEQAKVIRGDLLHALIELDMAPVTHTMELYKNSPAPLTISEMHPISSHGCSVDWLIVEDWYCPPGAEANFSERILRIEEPTYFPPPNPLAPPVTPPPCLRQGFITFGNLNRPSKLNEATLAAWVNIILQVPNSRLLLHSNDFDDYETDRVCGILQRYGLAKERFEIVGYLSTMDYLARYGEVDIVLDTLYYNGGVTSIDALWQGAPVLSCPGRSDQMVSSRVGGALLTAIGRPEWIARDLDHWQRMAVEAASDYERLRRWRFELRPQMSRSIVCDGERLANVSLEAIARIVDQQYESVDRGT